MSNRRKTQILRNFIKEEVRKALAETTADKQWMKLLSQLKNDKERKFANNYLKWQEEGMPGKDAPGLGTLVSVDRGLDIIEKIENDYIGEGP